MPPSASYHAGMANLSDIVSSTFWRVNPPDADPVETREWLEAFDELIAGAAGAAAAGPQHAVQELDRARAAAAVPGQPGARAAHFVDRALERARDGGEGQSRISGARRPHRELRLGGGSLRGGLQPLLPRRSTRGPGVFPAPFRAGRVCAGLPGGSSFRKPIESLSA